MGKPVPELPTIDPASVKIPLEDEIRAFIAKLESEREELPPGPLPPDGRAASGRQAPRPI